MTTTYGTLSIAADFPVDVTLVRRGGATPSVDGAVVRRQFRSSASRQTGKLETRVWRLTVGPDGEAALLASFDAARGSALPLSWQPPAPYEAGGTVPVRFVDDSLRIQRGPGAVFRASFELEECT